MRATTDEMMRLRLSSSVDVERLRSFLRDVLVTARVVDHVTLEVCAPRARTRVHERREIIGYVGVWNALNPRMRVTVD